MKTIRDIELQGKRVLIREDLNVPLSPTGEITSDSRIMTAIPTLRFLLEHKAKIIIMSHLGRPKKNEDIYKLDQVAKRLSELVMKPVKKLDKLTGPEVVDAVNQMQDGEIIMLENVRFDPRETKNDPSLSRELALLGDIFVNDAFSASHNEHSSICGVADFLPVFAGFQLERELQELNKLLVSPRHPFILLQGGAKVSTKIGVIEKLLPRIDKICIGGGMACTFLKARGYSVGKSIVEEDNLEIAREIMEKAKQSGKEIQLPVDFVVTDSIENSKIKQVVSIDRFPEDMIGADIGPITIENFKRTLIYGKTILANGPMGVFEVTGFKTGTLDLYRFLGDIRDAYEIAAGGDTSAAIEQFGLTNKFTYISSGGGATLEFLEGKVLPGIAKLNA